VPEVICDVSPVQYLHQAGLLDILRLRYGAITIPAAVAAELREGRVRGVDLPDFESLAWMRTGTLGVVLKAKETGLLPALAPVLDRLQKLRFRMDPETRQAVLRLAGEA
jgi:predicted nucleic acid-binding protein